ncbi:MAG TPA: ADOP family duplicated permease [Acidobacteriaceae bacterium]|nr:ADOP family duplicated permease [Acidobacteriaceae bacterium]
MWNWLSRSRRYEDLSASIEEHLTEKIDELMESGLSREEATYAARRQFGNATRIEEQGREVWQWPRIESIWADVKFALRQLAKSPAFTVTAVLTLALGIGANTGVFSLTRALLMKSLPVQDPARLVRISLELNNPNGAVRDMPVNSFMIDSLRRHSKTSSGIFGWATYEFVVQQSEGLRIDDGALVSGNTFQVLGVRPAAGRLLQPDDDQDGGGPDGWAAVLSYRYWQQHFGGDPSIVGRHITLSSHGVTIVGVAPKGFEGVMITARPDFYLPLHFEPALRGTGSLLRQRGSLWLTPFARVKSGIGFGAARAEIRSLFRTAVTETLPVSMQHVPVVEHAAFEVDPGGTGWSDLRNDYTRPLLLLQILVGVVLLVCCVNLAGVCLARAATREHEFAIRAALGAARARIMQQVLVESLLLAAAGAALAIAFSWATDRYLLRFLPNHEAAAALATRPDAALLAITGGTAVVCGLLFGLVPAWMATHFPLDPALRTSGKNQSHGSSYGGRRNFLLRRIFLPAQLALTLGLVAVAAMLGATVAHLRENSAGLGSRGVVLFHTNFERMQLSRADVAKLNERIVARVAQMPGVQSVSVATNTPLSGRSHLTAFAAADSPEPANSPYQYEIDQIAPAYFGTLGVQILAGHDFSGGTGDTGTCILSQAAARLLFPGAPAMGRSVRQNISSMSTGTSYNEFCRVIGVVADTRFASLSSAPPPAVYLPLTATSEALDAMTLLIRARKPAEADAAYRTALRELAPKTPETDPILLSQQLEDLMTRQNLLSTLSGFFAALALLLSGIGMYGLAASWVARRTAEIGVRMAIGATRGGIVLLVLHQVALLLLVGVAAGAALAFFAGHAIRAFLYEVNPANPAILALAVASLVVAAAIATLLPARRAASIDPMEALRME